LLPLPERQSVARVSEYDLVSPITVDVHRLPRGKWPIGPRLAAGGRAVLV